MKEKHPQIENKFINKNYYGSDLNKFVATYCKKEMVVNNIDLIINDYKKNDIKIVESKHSKEKLSIGQEILLKKLSDSLDTSTEDFKSTLKSRLLEIADKI
jgi:hypothetical protein